MKYLTIFIFGMLILSSSCKVCRDQKLEKSKVSYNGNEIKINGYYDADLIAIIVFYQNGKWNYIDYLISDQVSSQNFKGKTQMVRLLAAQYNRILSRL